MSKMEHVPAARKAFLTRDHLVQENVEPATCTERIPVTYFVT